jgi:hypothetical protein
LTAITSTHLSLFSTHLLILPPRDAEPGDHLDQHSLSASAKGRPLSQEQIKITVKIVFKTQVPGTCVTTADQSPTITTTSHAPFTSTFPTKDV